MKLRGLQTLNLLIVCLLSLWLALAPPANAQEIKKPFQRSLVIPGNGPDGAMYLGVMQAFEEAGKPIDLVIGACGGSIAATIANLWDNSTDRKAFVLSRDFYNIFSLFHGVRPIRLNEFFRTVFYVHTQSRRINSPWRNVPRLFDFRLLDFDLDDPKAALWRRPFRSNALTKAIMISAKLTYPPSLSGKWVSKDRKLFREVLFTDSHTAHYLEGKPAIGSFFPNSFVEPEVEPISHFSLLRAVRASVSDPYLFRPAEFDSNYYITGGVDLHPFHLADTLSNEVVSLYKGDWIHTWGFLQGRFLAVPIVQATFGFDPQKVYQLSMTYPTDYWVDFTDESRVRGIIPQIRRMWQLNLNTSLWIGPPKDNSYETFRENLEQRWQYGYERAREALRSPKGSRAHIRRRFDRCEFELTNLANEKARALEHWEKQALKD